MDTMAHASTTGLTHLIIIAIGYTNGGGNNWWWI